MHAYEAVAWLLTGNQELPELYMLAGCQTEDSPGMRPALQGLSHWFKGGKMPCTYGCGRGNRYPRCFRTEEAGKPAGHMRLCDGAGLLLNDASVWVKGRGKAVEGSS